MIATKNATIAAAFAGAPSSAANANGGIWGPGGPAQDANGIIYVTTGNSPKGPLPHVWGESLLAFGPALALAGTYTPWNHCSLDDLDSDLGGSSPIVIDLDPALTSTPHLLAFGGKQGNAYLLDRGHLPGALDARPPCGSDSSLDPSLLAPEPQPQFGKRGPLNVFGPYDAQCGNLDYAKMRSTPAYYKDADGGSWLYVTGTSKLAVCSAQNVAPSVVRVAIRTAPGSAAWLERAGAEPALVMVNPGSPVITSDGAAHPLIWVLDENAPRTASLADPNAPHPVLYAIDGTTMTALWQSSAPMLEVGGKYSTPAVAHGTVFVATDRLHAFGLHP